MTVGSNLAVSIACDVLLGGAKALPDAIRLLGIWRRGCARGEK